jgi:hypothetical protein
LAILVANTKGRKASNGKVLICNIAIHKYAIPPKIIKAPDQGAFIKINEGFYDI